MTIQDYLRRLKQCRQQLCVDRLILLLLVLTNALLLIHCLNRKPAVELSLPFMDGQVGIQSGEASQAYYKWWGLSLAELLGNLNPQNLSFVESRLQSLLSPNLYRQVHETLNRQFHQLREDNVSLSFEPLQLEFDENTHEVRVTGNSALSSGHQHLSGQKTFTFQFSLIRYRPVLAAIRIDSDLK
ncbi:type IV conjugative transfer system protein TraE [Endozoicomonas sp. 4G]|uniref:type IV conjugative transfer system protein TraE n=1 Tax=Endozoicomonas sp. 4G TaxID=2872754 RepID=UPI0020787228|nr:type IV conjugative transfer system protein TraE [Endozoicomonas sp. 4G]